jgi:aminoglycoside phosphotransferase (APT) family kinase protein
METRDLTLLGSGWEFDAWLTRDGWIVRFPRRAGMDELLAPERRVHQLVRPVLPPGIEVPLVEHVGQTPDRFPYRIAAHRFIHGIPADEVDQTFLPHLAAQLGEALGAIHSITEPRARAAGVLEMDYDEEGQREWFALPLEVLSALGGRDPVVDQAVRWARQVDLPTSYEGELSFIHHDLSPDHVLVDPGSGRLTGILDWTDAILGDAARDFVFLVAWGGWDYAEEVLKHYPRVIDAGFRSRLDFMARLLTVAWLGYAQVRGTEVEKLTGWLHNAFERPQFAT